MTRLGSLRSWLRAAFKRNTFERTMAEEMASHLESYAADLETRGWSADDARRRARAEFGSVEARKEECREARGLRLWDEMTGDLRYGVRLLRANPAFTAVAVLSLALGIGANTAIFTLVESVLWKELSVHAPTELRLLSWVSGPQPVMNSTWGGNGPGTVFSYPIFQELQQDRALFDRLFAFKPIGRLTAVIDGHAELVSGELVSGEFYSTLGVIPAAGRPIAPPDDVRQAESTVTVISDGFWARRFARDPSVVGRSIVVNQIPVTIIGVNPPRFTGLQPGRSPDVFLPLSMQPIVVPWRYGSSRSLLDNPDYWWVLMMGRLKPGVDARQAEAALDTRLQDVVRRTLPDRADRSRPRLRLLAGAKGVDDMRAEFSTPLFVLVALVGLVLVIACANLANLLLARAAARRRELSLRLALGAGPARLARQMLTEGLLLALLGGIAGVVIGYWLRDAIPYLLSTPWEPSPLHADFNGRVLALSLGVSVLTGLLFSLAPAWQAMRTAPAAALKQGVRAGSGSRPSARRLLIVFQVALSVVMLIGAGLFVRTLLNLRSAELGFQPDGIVLFDIDPPRTRYAGAARKVLFERLEEEIGRLPGIESASLSSDALVANNSSTTRVDVPGRVLPPGKGNAWINEAGDRFFETMGIPILAGRPLGPQDTATSVRVAVINQQFARIFFGEDRPIGRTFTRSGETVYLVVGICGDTRYNRVNAPMPPTFYRALAQAEDLNAMTFEVRSQMDTVALMNGIREAVRSVDPQLPIFDVRTQAEQIAATFSHAQMFAALTVSFGCLALVLACVGIYGIVANAVNSRVGEIGIRIALGARRFQVKAMLLRETAVLAAIGVSIGVMAAAWLARYVRTFLYNLTPFDPLSAGLAVLLMLAVAALAAWWPARAAARLDPLSALRHD